MALPFSLFTPFTVTFHLQSIIWAAALLKCSLTPPELISPQLWDYQNCVRLHAFCVAGEDEDRVAVCWILLPEQEAPGQAEETEGGGEERWRAGAAEKCKKHLEEAGWEFGVKIFLPLVKVSQLIQRPGVSFSVCFDVRLLL